MTVSKVGVSQCYLSSSPELALYMASFTSVEDLVEGREFILEPSCGGGAVLDSIKARGANPALIKAVEIDQTLASQAADKGFDVMVKSFKDYSFTEEEGSIKYVLMHPPFTSPSSDLVYLSHIKKAWDLLAEGGRLVAIVPLSFSYRKDQASVDFLSKVVERYGGWEELVSPEYRLKPSSLGKIALIKLDKLDKQQWSKNFGQTDTKVKKRVAADNRLKQQPPLF